MRKPRPLAQAKEYRAQAERQALFSVPIPPSMEAILFKESCFINSGFMVINKNLNPVVCRGSYKSNNCSIKEQKKPGIPKGITGHFSRFGYQNLEGIRAMAAFALDIDEAAGQPFQEAKSVGTGKRV